MASSSTTATTSTAALKPLFKQIKEHLSQHEYEQALELCHQGLTLDASSFEVGVQCLLLTLSVSLCLSLSLDDADDVVSEK